MVYHRIQKLLFSEYCDFEDMVLIESPFAQTTRDGVGLRQIHLGLTPTKLILAVDVLPSAEDADFVCPSEIDPEIETFELIAVYPVESLNVSIYRRKKRQTLKVHFCNNRILYLELGGYERRRAFWNLWCERVKFLCPEVPPSSKSETSVATSTSNSSLYLKSKRNVRNNGKQQIWCKFTMCDNNDAKEQRSKWMDKYLYLGPEFEHDPQVIKNYLPEEKPGRNAKKIFRQSSRKKPKSEPEEIEESLSENKVFKINRFGNGVREGCSTGLYLPAEEYEIDKPYSLHSTQSVESYIIYENVSSKLLDLSELAVRCWEVSNFLRNTDRHPRRYAITPQAFFLYGLGCCNVYEKEFTPAQLKQSLSASKMKEQELKLSVIKPFITAAVSCQGFHMDRHINVTSFGYKMLVPDKNALLFWTPENWLQLKPAYKYYLDFLQHLQTPENESKKTSCIKCCKKKNSSFFSRKISKQDTAEPNKSSSAESTIHQELQLDVVLTVWDFDSSTLSYELVSIDKELFLKIDPIELQVLMYQKSSRQTPNIRAIILFSKRITCLITTEILREQSEKARSKLIVKFLNIANRCDRVSSYQSCKSVLTALQSPPIYRLHHTWSYIRQHHATKYQLFKQLCYKYADPRSISYRSHFVRSSKNPPYLPYIGDILARLCDKVLYYSEENIDGIPVTNQSDQDTSPMNAFAKFLAILKSFYMNDDRFNRNLALETKLLKIEKEKMKNYDSEKENILKEVTTFLETSQKAAGKYMFDKNELARQYLLKARYREDKENFFHSIKLEPK